MANELVTVARNAGEYTLVAADTTDAKLVALWIGSKKSAKTHRLYQAFYEAFAAFVQKPLQAITYNDLQSWAEQLTGSVNTKRVTVYAIKSLFTFAHTTGYIRMNPAIVIKPPDAKNTLAQRILSEDQVLAMIHKTSKQRDNVLLRVLYASAGRISEVCGLTWGDVQPNGDTGQVTLFGKGGKTHAVKLSKATWQALQDYRQGAPDAAPVFKSQKGGSLTAVQVHRLVKQAAQRAGIPGNVSAHWLRHSHASHALDRGANIALVRDTLGHSSLEVTSRYTHAKPNESSALYLAV